MSEGEPTERDLRKRSHKLAHKRAVERDEARAEVERLRGGIDEALLCLTLIGHAGKTWAEKANAAKDVLARAALSANPGEQE